MNKISDIDVLLFDVNETLVDITILEPFFLRVFKNPLVLRSWFAELVLYSQTMTASGLYEPFGNLAVGVLRMVGSNHNITINDDDVSEFKSLLGNMPAHPDVIPALTRLQTAGFRLATLTNSAPTQSPTLLEKAGISEFFEQQLSVDAVHAFKPHPATYRHAAQELAVELDRICLVACHLWDTIGAQAAGSYGAFITRPNNNILIAENVPQPDFVARDLIDLADQLVGRS
ncbi:haloacid dehalogenase type II [Zhongshania aliphaticivorans]|jgi:2-haloacid dehalogenase|uniref:haloacid dehalogenase type II n=1 Tax=Zhongshania aliphaticivorans TaxID=1470434 RepID=UPI0012E57770|nr:haloacid dehalogenase type II [Zhongshania aliphaticivorans]MBQ0760671.1 haloacid dehalogenase type II [Zhongshania sp.]CAA0101836.1 2-haloalkanoic acid dehalogenase [Zhongshania aliphaticivorans]